MALVKSKDVIKATVEKISDFQKGIIKPLSTGIPHLDHNLLGGLRPSDVLVICALPYHGKTYMEEQISTYMEVAYTEDVIFVKCLWELEMFKVVLRQLSQGSGKSVRDVINNEPDEETKALYQILLSKYLKENIYIQGEPVSPTTFTEDISEIIKKYPDKKIVVTIDNLENVLLDGRDQKTVMDTMVRAVNVLKKQHSFIDFIILNQLNRNIEERDNPKNHFPKEGDIYGTAALFKIADIVVVKHMPYRLGIQDKYGIFPKNRYLFIDDEFKTSTMGKTMSFDPRGMVFYHYLKSRGVEETYDKQDLACERIFDIPDDKIAPRQSGGEFVTQVVDF